MASTHLQRIVKSNPRPAEYFGSTVKCSGDGSRLISLAPGFGTTDIDELPIISYYEKSGTQWVYQNDVPLPNDIIPSDHLGTYAQINYNGTVLVLSAQDYNSTPHFNGAVYIYTLVNGSWELRKRILISPRNEGPGNQTNQFGFHFALSDDGNTLAVSAPYMLNDALTSEGGAVYVLETTNNWQNYTEVELFSPNEYTTGTIHDKFTSINYFTITRYS